MDILDRFITSAKESLAEGYYDYAPVVSVRPARPLSLKQKFVSQDFGLICEIKHASPAGEYAYREIDAEVAVREFRSCGADAISVVVEPKIFRGSMSNISSAKTAGLPVLFKDFVFTKEQIQCAARSGADAVLLVVKVADRVGADLDELIGLAHKNDLEVLLESYDACEFRRALETDADILGINNRELTTLKLDITRTGRILRQIGLAKINKPIISESGIKSAADVAFVRKSGVRGALVGTAIWTANDLGAKIRELKSGGLHRDG